MHVLRSLFALALVAVFLVLPGCPQPQPQPGTPATGGVISCASKAVSDHAGDALGPVNECLRGSGDVTACLLGLIKPAVGITTDVILCLTRHEGSAANAASQANPDNAIDARRAARAREFLESQHARFAD